MISRARNSGRVLRIAAILVLGISIIPVSSAMARRGGRGGGFGGRMGGGFGAGRIGGYGFGYRPGFGYARGYGNRYYPRSWGYGLGYPYYGYGWGYGYPYYGYGWGYGYPYYGYGYGYPYYLSYGYDLGYPYYYDRDGYGYPYDSSGYVTPGLGATYSSAYVAPSVGVATTVMPAQGRYLGIDEEPVTLPDGRRAMKVTKVYPGTSAERASLQVGDVILSINGYLTEQRGNLAWIIANAAPNNQLKLSVKRASNGEERSITAQLQ